MRNTKKKAWVCWNCSHKVKTRGNICPHCGRLLTRNREKITWMDLVEPENVSEKLDSTIDFDSIPEETEQPLEGEGA